MHRQWFTNDPGNRPARIERSVRVLEYHLHPLPQGAQVFPAGLGQVLTFIKDTTFRRSVQLDQGPAGGGLPAAAFTNQAQGFTAVNIEGDVVYRFYCTHLALDQNAASDGEIFL